MFAGIRGVRNTPVDLDLKGRRAMKPRVVGEVQMLPIETVGKNDWNPNYMTPFEKESLKYGLEHDGWLASQALLVWGTDEKGTKKNIIIDGEHRYTVAKELGFKEAPMVLLKKLTQAQAKALTVKMNGKRGSFNQDELGALLRSIQYDLGDVNLSQDLGIQEEQLMKYLADQDVNVNAAIDESGKVTGPEGSTAGIPSSNVRMIQLFLDDATHGEFSELIRRLATKFGTKTVTETTLEAVRRASHSATDQG